jgi:GNAT superfamily N-acetyltransferase
LPAAEYRWSDFFQAGKHRIGGFQMATTHDSPSIDIRTATLADVPVILAFIVALAEYEKLAHAVMATQEMLREHLFGPRPAAEVLIASMDEHPVGFALFFPSFSTFLARPGIYLEDLFVRPEARGRGVGKALLKSVAKIAAQRHCGRLEWAVLDWNEPAIAFYKKLGAVAMDEWTTMRVTGETLDQLSVDGGSDA